MKIENWNPWLLIGRMIDVVCGLIEDGAGRVLACRRAAGQALAGLWEFPGGKLEPGEDAAAALVRELREELGVVVESGEALAPVEHDYGGFVIRLIPLRCRVVSGEPHPHEHDAIRWVGPHETGALEWAAADLPVVAEWAGKR